LLHCASNLLTPSQSYFLSLQKMAGSFLTTEYEFSYTFLHRGQCQHRYSCNHTDRAVLSTHSWLYYSSVFLLKKRSFLHFIQPAPPKMLRSLPDKAQKRAEVASQIKFPPVHQDPAITVLFVRDVRGYDKKGIQNIFERFSPVIDCSIPTNKNCCFISNTNGSSAIWNTWSR